MNKKQLAAQLAFEYLRRNNKEFSKEDFYNEYLKALKDFDEIIDLNTPRNVSIFDVIE